MESAIPGLLENTRQDFQAHQKEKQQRKESQDPQKKQHRPTLPVFLAKSWGLPFPGVFQFPQPLFGFFNVCPGILDPFTTLFLVDISRLPGGFKDREFLLLNGKPFLESPFLLKLFTKLFGFPVFFDEGPAHVVSLRNGYPAIVPAGDFEEVLYRDNHQTRKNRNTQRQDHNGTEKTVCQIEWGVDGSPKGLNAITGEKDKPVSAAMEPLSPAMSVRFILPFRLANVQDVYIPSRIF
jgi:hypothetical protein